MRDAVFLTVLPFLIFAIFRRPFIGLGLWMWTAMFFPNGWVYGIASNIRYNLLFAGLTIFVYLVSKNKARLHLGQVGVLVILFFMWATLSTIFGMGTPEIAWEFWGRLAKIMALFIFILLIMDKKLHVDFFLWCLIFSLGFYAGLEGLKFIASGGGHKIEGLAGHVLGDRNELSIAMAMLLPICFYLMDEYGNGSKFVKLGLLGLIALLITSIIGTGSRGGMIALSGVGGYLFIKSKKKILFTLLVVCVGGAIVGLIPDQWFERMDTIGKVDSDASFMGRVVAWKLSFILAAQNPIFGGGFKALENFAIWFSLSQDFNQYPFFYTGTATPDLERPHAAHSIYFQVLGDHGFIGLGLFVAFLGSSFFKAGVVAKKIREVNGPGWAINLSTMMRLSIFTYALGGAALSFAYFDLIYAVFAIVIVLEHKFLPEFVKNREK